MAGSLHFVHELPLHGVDVPPEFDQAHPRRVARRI
jgi:hypothetical protein